MHGCDENEPYPCCGAKSGHLDWCVHAPIAMITPMPADFVTKLCALVKEAGLTMRLYGQPVDAAGLKTHVQPIVDAKLELLAIRLERQAEERAWTEVWSDVERATKP